MFDIEDNSGLDLFQKLIKNQRTDLYKQMTARINSLKGKNLILVWRCINGLLFFAAKHLEEEKKKKANQKSNGGAGGREQNNNSRQRRN